MALKVGGTEVITNARQLSNIASVDATTVAALGAAGVGGGGGSFDAVASGAISNGDPVSLNSDGTVTTTSGFAGAVATFLSATTASEINVVYDSNANKSLIIFRRSDTNHLKAVVATVSGTSLSFGSEATITTNTTTNVKAAFDSNANKVVIVWRDNTEANTPVRAVVGTISGTSVSFGTIANVTDNSAMLPIIAFDSNSNKVVVGYRHVYDGSTGKAKVGTISGTSISFGTEAVFQNSNTDPMDMTFDSNSNKIVIIYKHNADSDDGKAIVGTVSGTSISFGTAVTWSTGNGDKSRCTFDSNSNKVVIVFKDTNNSSHVSSVVGTVSGTSISFGSTAVVKTTGCGELDVTFDTNLNKAIVVFNDQNDNKKGLMAAGTISGTSISFGSTIPFDDSENNIAVVAFDSSSNQVIICWQDQNDSYRGKAVVGIPLGISNFFNWVGYASEAISNSATGTINVIAGVNEGQSSLSIGQTYYFTDAATLSTTAVSGREVGKALSATKLLITQGSIS